MKRIICLFLILVSFCRTGYSNPVTLSTAKTVASNFYVRNYKAGTPELGLAYTEYATNGQPVYYVFNVNTSNGFVIVSAEDAAHPILGASNKGSYVMPHGNNNFAWWMNCRKQEIEYARSKNIAASTAIAQEWAEYINNPVAKNVAGRVDGVMTVVGPLLQTTWDQPYPYNAMCPGGSVTGCVATAMAQIMRYWSYPSHGHGYSAYIDEQAYDYQSDYGYLSADYDTSNYVWAAMPYSISSNNDEIAKLMYDCGVSVAMDYSTGESGAWVVTGDYPLCSQVAFVKYFGYDANTIQGLYESKYSMPSWIAIIENELNNNRPVQYVGWDSISPTIEPGHTWVCDGYNSANDLFDMNWGWSGAGDGYFALNALDVSYNFNWWNEALIGIEPPATSPYFSASPTFGCANLTVHFSDSSISDASVTSYQWLFPGGTPGSSINANPTVVYSTPGTYDVTEVVGDVNGTDTLIRKAYISVESPSGSLPVKEDFQSSVFPPAGWVINNPHNYSYTWQLNASIGGYGTSSQSMYFNNCYGYDDYAPPGKAALDIIGERQQIYTPKYDFTGVTNPVLYFDVAYAPYNNSSTDTLDIYYSTDCGATFIPVYSKGGITLGTTGNYVSTGADTNNMGCFVPANNNWRTDTIHISAIAGAPNVMFSFENRSGNGSPLYIDNINIPGGGPTNISNIASAPSVTVYPNPNNGHFTIGVTNISGIPFVKLYNVLGQEVYTSQLKNQDMPIDISSQPDGVYIYRIYSESGAAISTGRVVVE